MTYVFENMYIFMLFRFASIYKPTLFLKYMTYIFEVILKTE